LFFVVGFGLFVMFWFWFGFCFIYYDSSIHTLFRN
jgi:hypothetical protein